MKQNPEKSPVRALARLFAAQCLLFVTVFQSSGAVSFAQTGNTPPAQPAAPELIEQANGPDATLGTWNPGPGTVFTYPVSTQAFTLTVDALVPFTPSLASAGYFLYNPVSGETINYPASAVHIPGGARLTGASIPLEVSGQDIQFYISPQGGGPLDFSPRYRIVRLSTTFVPVVARPGPLEPNNSACEATVVAPDTNYNAGDDDTYDWFKLPLATRGTISVNLNSFGGVGAIDLWQENGGCDNVGLLKIAPLPPSGNPILTQAGLTAGNYYVRIFSAAPTGQPYQFNWQFASQPNELEPNNSPCEATVAQPNTTYTGRDDDQFDWFRVSVTATTSVAFTVTGMANSNARIQFFGTAGNSGSCTQVNASPSSEAVINNVQTVLQASSVPAGTAFVSIRADGASTGQPYTFRWTQTNLAGNFEVEPNNSACNANPLVLGQQMQGYLNDDNDFYYIDLPGDNGSVSFVVTDVPLRDSATPGPANMQVWFELYKEQTSCNDLKIYDNEGNWVNMRLRANTGNYWVMGIQQLAAGRYYVRARMEVPGVGPYNTTQPYRLWATRTNTGVWSPRVFNAPYFNGQGTEQDNDVTVFWWGLGGGSSGVQLTLTGGNCSVGNPNCGCPVGPSGGQFSSTGEVNNNTFYGVGRGYYVLKVQGSGPTYPTNFYDEKPIKVQCEFNNGFDPYKGAEGIPPLRTWNQVEADPGTNR